jgi:hypothetical protein
VYITAFFSLCAPENMCLPRLWERGYLPRGSCDTEVRRSGTARFSVCSVTPSGGMAFTP